MDFGRQPQPVSVQLGGHPEDVANWMRIFRQRVENNGDNTEHVTADSFVIYPRAVND